MSFPIAVTTAVMLYGSSPAGTGQLCETGSDWKRMAQAPIVSASVVAPSSRRPMSGVQDRGVSNSDSGRPVPPADPTLPDEGSCKMDSGYFCTHDCQAGYGKKYDVHETCDVVVHDVCVPTAECPDNGPIDDDDIDDELQSLPN